MKDIPVYNCPSSRYGHPRNLYKLQQVHLFNVSVGLCTSLGCLEVPYWIDVLDTGILSRNYIWNCGDENKCVMANEGNDRGDDGCGLIDNENCEWVIADSGEVWDVPDPPESYPNFSPCQLPEKSSQEVEYTPLPVPKNSRWAEKFAKSKNVKRTVVKEKHYSHGKKLFIKNINFDTTQRDLWDFLTQFGPVERCTLLRDHRKRSRGIGFVTFKNAECAEKVLSAHPDHLCFDGRNLSFELAKRRTYKYHSESDNNSDVISQENYSKERGCPNSMEQDPGAPIECLDDHVMLIIFSYLSIKEKVKVERVCSRWRYLSIKSWQSITRLNFHEQCRRFGGLSDRIMQRLLQRVSRAMVSLDISASPRNLTDRTLGHIAKLCPWIVSLNLSGLTVSNKGLQTLAESCHQLQEIILKDCPSLGEKGLWWLFHQCKKLQNIDLLNNRRLTGSCFHMLGNNLQALNLSGCCKLQDVGLEKIAAASKDLQQLHLGGCSEITDQGIINLMKSCRSLKKLYMNKFYKNVTSGGLLALEQLKLIQELQLEGNPSVENSVLTAVGRNCHQLRILNISSCNKDISCAGIECLSECPLEELHINYLHQVGDVGLVAVAMHGSLRILNAIGCSALGNPTLEALAAHCCHLVEMDFSACNRITNSGIQVLVDSLEGEGPNTVKLVVGGTLGFMSGVEVRDGVNVLWEDHSRRWLQRDGGIYFYAGSSSSDEYSEFDDNEFLDNDDPLSLERFHLS